MVLETSDTRSSQWRFRWATVVIFLLVILVVLNLGTESHWARPPEGSANTIESRSSVAGTADNDCPTILHDDSNQALTFAQAVQVINWDQYQQLKKENTAAYFEQILKPLYQIAFDFAVKEPRTPINATCRPQPLQAPPTEKECQLWKTAFNGSVRSKPLKVGHAVLLGFDIDTLEIHLREICDVVDKVFIIEATISHNRLLSSKSLAWEAVKQQPRFAFCRDKVVHLIMDDVDASYTKLNDMWSVEGLQEKRRWQKIVEWNQQTHFFGPDDIIGFGDTDEIVNRYNIHLLKYCSWRNTRPVDVGIWFPMGRINQAFRTDWPVRGHPYSLGDPTFHVFGQAENPTRNRGRSPNFLVGGMHLSHYGYLIYQLLKQMSCSECQGASKYLDELAQTVKTGKWADLELAWSGISGGWKARTIPLDKMDARERQQLVYLPWFYDCNRQRYSMWEGHPDSRTSDGGDQKSPENIPKAQISDGGDQKVSENSTGAQTSDAGDQKSPVNVTNAETSDAGDQKSPENSTKVP